MSNTVLESMWKVVSQVFDQLITQHRDLGALRLNSDDELATLRKAIRR